MLYKIPIKKLQEGMRHCANNIRRLILDVELLLKNSSEWHAIAMAIFAYEELGKFGALKDVKSKATGDVVEVDKELFISHKYKQQMAYELIEDKESLTLLSKDDFKSTLFEMKDETVVSPGLRLDCVFVNWDKDKNDWVYGAPSLPNRIRRFCNEIARTLNRLEYNAKHN